MLTLTVNLNFAFNGGTKYKRSNTKTLRFGWLWNIKQPLNNQNHSWTEETKTGYKHYLLWLGNQNFTNTKTLKEVHSTSVNNGNKYSGYFRHSEG